MTPVSAFIEGKLTGFGTASLERPVRSAEMLPFLRSVQKPVSPPREMHIPSAFSQHEHAPIGTLLLSMRLAVGGLRSQLFRSQAKVALLRAPTVTASATAACRPGNKGWNSVSSGPTEHNTKIAQMCGLRTGRGRTPTQHNACLGNTQGQRRATQTRRAFFQPPRHRGALSRPPERQPTTHSQQGPTATQSRSTQASAITSLAHGVNRPRKRPGALWPDSVRHHVCSTTA
jgi:hypothetical protein